MRNPVMPSDCKISIIVLGESGVGKTSMLLRFTKGTFKDTAQSITIIDCLHTNITVKDTKVRMELWDTGGQDRFRTIVKQYFRKADGVLLIFDVTDVSSFHKLSGWLEELRENNERAVAVIVGNKTDHEQSTQVSKSIVQRYAKSENLEYFESSAKTGENIYNIFEKLTEKILIAKEILSPPVIEKPLSEASNVQSVLEAPPMEDRGIIVLKPVLKEKTKKEKKCC